MHVASSAPARFPDGDTIARAIVEAARLYGEEPIAILRGATSRARHVAFEALLAAFPDASRIGLARCLGYRNARNGLSQVYLARRCQWWREDHVDEVLGVLVAGQYGEQAA